MKLFPVIVVIIALLIIFWPATKIERYPYSWDTLGPWRYWRRYEWSAKSPWRYWRRYKWGTNSPWRHWRMRRWGRRGPWSGGGGTWSYRPWWSNFF